MFTNPPIGTVGLTEAEAVEKYGDVDVFTSTFRPMKSTISGNPVRTFVKILVDAATDKVIGLHMCGEDGPEIMQVSAAKLALTKSLKLNESIGRHVPHGVSRIWSFFIMRQFCPCDVVIETGERHRSAWRTE